MKNRKIVFLGLLTTLSLLMFLIESLFPPLFVPGAKLGLGNIFVMLALIYFNVGSALLVVVAKCLLAGIFGGFSAVLYSIPAGVISLLFIWLLLKTNRFGLISVACVGASIHNLVQNAMFAILMRTAEVLVYSPYLVLLGVLAGCVTGLSTLLILRSITPLVKNKFYIN